MIWNFYIELMCRSRDTVHTFCAGFEYSDGVCFFSFFFSNVFRCLLHLLFLLVELCHQNQKVQRPNGLNINVATGAILKKKKLHKYVLLESISDGKWVDKTSLQSADLIIIRVIRLTTFLFSPKEKEFKGVPLLLVE